MEDIFKIMFDRQLSDEDSADEKKRKSSEFRATGGFYPSDPQYDPQLRLKQRLRMLFPHLPGTPGMPPRER